MGVLNSMVRGGVVAASGLLAVLAAAASTGGGWEPVGVGASGGLPDGDSGDASVANNGRTVVFGSGAGNLLGFPVAGRQVYLRDLRAGTTALVSRTPSGGAPDDSCTNPCVSANGRFVVFQSNAGDLVEGVGGGVSQVYLADLRTGTVSLVSASPQGEAADATSVLYGATLSKNGRWVVFQSLATNLVEGADTHGYHQIYLRDMKTGAVTLVSRDRDDPLSGATGSCSTPTLSPNGRFVAFGCNGANLVPGNSNGQMHLYLADRRRRTVKRVSEAADGTLGNGYAELGVVSSNGRLVAFDSSASNLVDGDVNGKYDVFLKDMVSGEVRILSAGGNGDSYEPAMAPNGKSVWFYSDASNLVDGDGNGASDLFRVDARSGAATRLSVGPEGVEGDGDTYGGNASLSGNGRWIVISSRATNLAPAPGPGDPVFNVFLRSAR